MSEQRKVGRPKGFSPSAETRAKISATMRERGGCGRPRKARPPEDAEPAAPYVRRIRPLPGTDEYRLFMKIAYRCRLGAAAAHAELRRGV